ncbi:MAG: hypothetical protein KGJ55_03605 [Gammaproteobacteria bacterium]|nr:hypothetical protein [Gammaproteobacteria bacterium]
MKPPAGWISLMELDRAAGRPKGSAFRAFKALLPELRENRDFAVFDHRRADAARLHAAGRIYRSSVNPVLLAPATARRLLAALARPPDDKAGD